MAKATLITFYTRALNIKLKTSTTNNAKQILLLIVFCCLFLVTKGQSYEIDSLKKLLQNHTNKDTIRVNLLNKITQELESRDIDSFLQYATEAAKLAKKLNFKKGSANHLSIMGLYYETQSDYSKAIEYYQKSIQINKELDDKSETAKCLNSIGEIYERLSNYPKALEYYKNSLEIKESIKDKKGIAAAWHDIGFIYYRYGDYPKALDFYQKGLHLYEEIRDKNGIADCLNNIGLIYEKQGEFSKALVYYQQILKIDEEIGNKRNISTSLHNIGVIYRNQNYYSKALDYLQRSLKLRREIGYNWGISNVLSSIGTTYEKYRDYPKALDYHQKSLKIAIDIGSKDLISQVNRRLARVYLITELPQKAQYHAQISYDIAKEINNVENIKLASGILAEVYNKIGEYKKAYDYHVIFKVSSDSLLNEGNTKKITRLQAEFEFQQEKDSISLAQEKERIAYQIELTENKRILQLVIFGLLVSIIIGAILFRFYKSKQNANQILSLMNAKVIEQKEELGIQAEELKATNNKLVELDEFKSAMTGMIVHDLKNPLSVIINRAESDNVIRSNSQSMLNLVLNILDVQKFEEAKMSIVTELHQLSLIFDNAIQQITFWLKEKNIQLNVNVNPQIFIQVDYGLIVRVIVNLLHNAIKYSPNNSRVDLSAIIENQKVKIEIKDNGIGIPQNQLDKVFEKYRQVNAKSIGNVRSTGIGLTYCKMVIEAHNSEIRVTSKINKGTTFYFLLPLAEEVDITNATSNGNLKRNELALLEEEISYLSTYYAALKNEELYDYSALSSILNKINNSKSINIKTWVESMENTLLSQNQELFDSLLDMIKDKKPNL